MVFPLQVALQGSAMDPTTGTIDMDLIQTGISAGDRTLRAQLTQELRALIQRASLAAIVSLDGCLYWRSLYSQTNRLPCGTFRVPCTVIAGLQCAICAWWYMVLCSTYLTPVLGDSTAGPQQAGC